MVLISRWLPITFSFALFKEKGSKARAPNANEPLSKSDYLNYWSLINYKSGCCVFLDCQKPLPLFSSLPILYSSTHLTSELVKMLRTTKKFCFLLNYKMTIRKRHTIWDWDITKSRTFNFAPLCSLKDFDLPFKKFKKWGPQRRQF